MSIFTPEKRWLISGKISAKISFTVLSDLQLSLTKVAQTKFHFSKYMRTHINTLSRKNTFML